MKLIRTALLMCATALSACVVLPPDTVAGERPLYPQQPRRIYEGSTVVYRDAYPARPQVIIYDNRLDNDLIRQQRWNELQRARAQNDWEEQRRENQRRYYEQLHNERAVENQRLRNELRRRDMLERHRENLRHQNDILRREDCRVRRESGGGRIYPQPQLNNPQNNRSATPPRGTPMISTSPSTNVCQNGHCR